MEIRQLEIFVRVAQLCSFSKAADALNMSQSVLSRQIGRLEQELGKHLLYRNGRGVTPTEAGKRLLARGVGILHQLEAAKQETSEDQKQPSGKVILGMPPRIGSLLTGPLVAAFCESFPQASISVAEGPTATILEWLTLGRLDVGLLNNPPFTPQLQYERMKTEDLYLVGSTTHGKPLKGTVKLKSLPRFPLILPCRPNAIRNLIDDECAKRGILLNVVLDIDPIAGIIDLVERGFGYAILAENTIPTSLRKPTLQSAKIVAPRIVNQLFVGTPAQRAPSHLTRLTIELIKAQVKASDAKLSQRPPTG